jgi:hypothetical protein
MNENEIAEKVRYILEPIGQSLVLFYRTSQASGSSERESEFGNENVELLLQLESKINTVAGKDFFWQLVGFNFIWPIPKTTGTYFLLSMPKRKAEGLVRQHCEVAAMVYLKSDRVDEVLNGLLQRIKDYSAINEQNVRIISSIHQVAFNEPHLFSDDHLKKIEAIVGKFHECIENVHSRKKKLQEQRSGAPFEGPGQILAKFLPPSSTAPQLGPMPSSALITILDKLLSELTGVLAIIRFERTKQELRGVSSQINQDKKYLIDRYGELGLSKDLIEALETIDTEIEETGSKFQFSKSIGFVRKIYEESLRQFATKIRDTIGLPIPQWTNKGKMGEAINYFRSIKLISDKEEQMLTGFSGLISDTGSHSLTSEKYEVRIAKNILVEICSYLIDKVDNFLKNHSQRRP